MALHRSSLLANGIFSIVSGLALSFGSDLISQTLILAPRTLIALIGIGLVAFGSVVLRTGLRRGYPGYGATLVISALDFGWVLGTLPLVFFSFVTPVGKGLIAFIALIVGPFGVLQILGIDRGFPREGTKRLVCFRFKILSGATSFWTRLSKLEDIANYFPDLASAGLVQGEGLEIGVIRECVDVAGQTWREEVVSIGEREFALRFATEDPAYPYPLSEMTGGWKIEGDEVEVWWLASAKGNVPAWLLFPMMAAKAERSLPVIIACLDGKDGSSLSEKRRSIRDYLPGVC